MRPYDDEYGPIVDGRLDITEAGVRISGFEIPAWINPLAPGISVSGLWLRPLSPPPTSAGVINVETAGTDGFSASNILIDPYVSSPHWTGIMCSKGAAFSDVEIRGCVDGFSIHDNTNPVRLQLVTVGHHSWFAPGEDPYHADGSHCDGGAFRNAKDATMIDCTLNSFIDPKRGSKQDHWTNSALQITGTCENLVIRGGFMDGGVYTINVAPGAYPALGELSGVRFGNNQHPDGAGKIKHVSIPKDAVVAVSGLITDGKPTVSRY